VTFIKVHSIYHSWIHPLHHSPLFLLSPFLERFHRSHVSVFIHECIIFPAHSLFYLLLILNFQRTSWHLHQVFPVRNDLLWQNLLIYECLALSAMSIMCRYFVDHLYSLALVVVLDFLMKFNLVFVLIRIPLCFFFLLSIFHKLFLKEYVISIYS
jgi:hypothetical protein